MTTFRHMLMIKFGRDVTRQQIQDLADGLAKMPQIMDYIRRYEFGPDLALSDETFDFGLIADFDSEEDWRTYLNHSDHQILVHNLLKPVVDQLVRVQYEVD